MSDFKKQITLALLFMAAVLLLASYYVKEKQEDYRAAVTIKLAEQETNLVRLAELLDRESVDAVVSRVVKDCEFEERTRFDELLGGLSQLTRVELLELDQLFPACGSYFADRQAVLASRFSREVGVFEEYKTLLELTGSDAREHTEKLETWSHYDNLESQKSELVSELVSIQEEIIELLLAGELVNSAAINEKLQAAQAAKDKLLLLGNETDLLRVEISNL